MKQYQEEPVYQKLWNIALQAAMSDDLVSLKTALKEEEQLHHFKFPLNELTLMAGSMGSLEVFKYLTRKYASTINPNNTAISFPYPVLPRLDLTVHDNMIFRQAWRRGHLDILEELILTHHIARNNSSFYILLETEDYPHKAKIKELLAFEEEKDMLELKTPKIIPSVEGNKSLNPPQGVNKI